MFLFCTFLAVGTCAGQHLFAAFWRAIMERAKQDIPGHIHRAIITFKIPVMQLMVKMSDSKASFIAHQQRIKTGMAENS